MGLDVMVMLFPLCWIILEHCCIVLDSLMQERELGRGCHGKVWLAKWRGVDVALKELLSGGVASPDDMGPDPFAEVSGWGTAASHGHRTMKRYTSRFMCKNPLAPSMIA